MPKQIIRIFLIISFVLLLAAAGGVYPWSIVSLHFFSLFMVAIILFYAIRQKQRILLYLPLARQVIGIGIVCIIALIYSGMHSTSIKALLLAGNLFLIFYLTIYSMPEKNDIRFLVKAIIVIALFISATSFFYLPGNPFASEHISPNNRISGLFVNPSHYAGFLEMVIPLSLGLLIGARSRKSKMKWAALSLFFMLCIVLSLSRGGWAGCIFSIIFMGTVLFSSHKKSRPFFLVILLAFICILLFFGINQSFIKRIESFQDPMWMNNRLVVWKATLSMIAEKPVTGSGPGTFSYFFTQYQPPGFKKRFYYAHNDYLQFTAEAGIFILPIIIYLILSFYRKTFKILKKLSNKKEMGIQTGAMAGILSILIHSGFDFNLHIPANAMLFAFLAAIAIAPEVNLQNMRNTRQNITCQ